MTLPPVESEDHSTRVTGVTSQFDQSLIGVPVEPVLLRWRVESETAGSRQVGWQVRARRSAGDEWSAGEPQVGDDALDVTAPGVARSRSTIEYGIRVATEQGWSAWSETLRIEYGVGGGELSARVIDIDSDIAGPVPILRREFELEQVPSRALLRISALGVYNVRINGVEVTDGILNPGWTAYQARVLIDTLDVTTHLRPGRNAIAITVADGWFRGRMGFAGRTAIYGDRIGAIAQLESIDGDAVTTIAATDDTWTGGFGPVRSASIYDGSVRDDRYDSGDPSVAGFDDAGWSRARVVPVDPGVFEPRRAAPVRVFAEREMVRGRRGDAVTLDAGQNIAGWVRLTVEGRAGDTVIVRHAEVLEPDGSLHTAALRSARATDEYVLGRDGRVTLEPSFTFHGFRYAEVTGTASVIEAAAVAISSDNRPRSTFRSSLPLLDRFHENVRWSQLDNFVSLPTDCPQRDERLGWTGDAQAFAATASTLFDTREFWRSWLIDLELDQTDEGGVASIVPNIIATEDMRMGGEVTDTMGRAGWADAATIVPWSVYRADGSKAILRAQLSSMRRWVEHLRRRSGAKTLLPPEPFQYGDWLDPDAPAARPWAAKVDSLFVANAFYVNSARLLARAEEVIGEADAAAEHHRLADTVADAVWKRWGREAGDTQTGASMCIAFGIGSDLERAALGDRLAAEVRRERGRIATGFLGTPLVLDALSETGHLEEAFTMLTRREAPSWLYQVERGATTVWERWDAIKPDGSIHRGEMDTTEGDSMISFNHYAYGAMIDWVYRTVGGIAPIDAGYRRTRIAPRPSREINAATASIDTSFGTVATNWWMDSGSLQLDLTVPFGVTAVLDLPTTAASALVVSGVDADARELGHGRYTIHVSNASIVGERA